MDQSNNALAQGSAQVFEPRLCSDEIADLAFLDQRAHPIALPSLVDCGAILRQSQRPWDWRGGHDQDINRLPLSSKLKPLAYAKAVLFIDHRKAQIAKGDIRLKHRMGADQDLDRATFQRCKLRPSFSPFVASGQKFKHHTGLLRQRAKPFKVLTRKDFCRGHQNTLPAGLDRAQKRHKGDQRLARSHVPLK